MTRDEALQKLTDALGEFPTAREFSDVFLEMCAAIGLITFDESISAEDEFAKALGEMTFLTNDTVHHIMNVIRSQGIKITKS